MPTSGLPACVCPPGLFAIRVLPPPAYLLSSSFQDGSPGPRLLLCPQAPRRGKEGGCPLCSAISPSLRLPRVGWRRGPGTMAHIFITYTQEPYGLGLAPRKTKAKILKTRHTPNLDKPLLLVPVKFWTASRFPPYLP